MTETDYITKDYLDARLAELLQMERWANLHRLRHDCHRILYQ